MKYIGALIVVSALAFSAVWADLADTGKKARAREEEIAGFLEEKFVYADGFVESEPPQDSDGMRVQRRQKTTSESQSYAMLIAVLTGRREMFNSAWSWAQKNLQIRGDHLFAWLWEDGKIKDTHSAADADEDIALALIIAHERWGEERYLQEARSIINDIWEKDTKEAGGRRYLGGGDWIHEDPEGITINLSYLAPYMYRIFAKVDPAHDWQEIVDSSYEILKQCSRPRGIAKNWCRVDHSGKVAEDFAFNDADPNLFSYDAMRTPFRIALDYHIFGEKRAREYLAANNLFFLDWGKYHKIFAVYNEQGVPQVPYESYASYGAQLASFTVLSPITADRIFNEKIATVDLNTLTFFDLAWLWFGLRFYNDGFKDDLNP